MKLDITNGTDDIIVCKTVNNAIVILPMQSLELDVPCDSFLKIEHSKPSYIEKKWFGTVRHLKVDISLDYEHLFAIPNGRLCVYSRNKRSNEYEQVYYDVLYLDCGLSYVRYHVQGKETVEKALLKRERNIYILSLFLLPVIELIIERITTNGIALFFVKVALGRTYYAIVLTLFLIVFVIGGLAETINYIHERKKLKSEIYGMFYNPDL